MLVTGEQLSERIGQISLGINFYEPADLCVSQLCYLLLPYVNMTQF